MRFVSTRLKKNILFDMKSMIILQVQRVDAVNRAWVRVRVLPARHHQEEALCTKAAPHQVTAVTNVGPESIL